MRRALLLSILLACACHSAPADQEIEQLNVFVAVQPDGSALVREQLTVNLGAASVGEFRRFVPAWKHDGVSEIVASMDGAPFPVGDGVGHAEVGGARHLDVRWRFAPVSNAHVFGLSYRAANVVHLSGIRGTVSWRVIGGDARTRVADASVTLVMPDSAVHLQDPWVDEPGWKVTRTASGVSAQRGPVGSGETATAGMEFTIDRMTAHRPQWQTDSERAVQFIPAFISAALFILVIAVGALWMLRMKYPVHPSPADTAPRNAGHARVLWRAARQSGRSIVGDVIAAGLVDRERVDAARDLWRAGIAVIVLGVLAWAVTRYTLWQYGAWPLVIAWSVVVAGVIFLVGAARFPVLTESGARDRVLYCARISDGRTAE